MPKIGSPEKFSARSRGKAFIIKSEILNGKGEKELYSGTKKNYA
jgi:hypothetical protein